MSMRKIRILGAFSVSIYIIYIYLYIYLSCVRRPVYSRIACSNLTIICNISLYTRALKRIWRVRDRAAKTTEDRAAAQQQRKERKTSETEEQREVRLQRMCITNSERMAHGRD